MLRLILRTLAYYRRTNLALALGFAAVVATLGGALLVGDSVRASLASLVDQRLGRTQSVLTAANPFREQLATELGGAPLLALEGTASAAEGGRRANQVQVYGVDQRFWSLNALPPADDVSISPALARELALQPGATILVRVEKPSAIPRESLHGRKDDSSRALRLRVGTVRPPEHLGEFTLRLQQGPVRAIFIPLTRLQRELAVRGRASTAIFDRQIANDALRHSVTLDDLGVRLRDSAVEATSTTLRLGPSNGTTAVETASPTVRPGRRNGVPGRPARSTVAQTVVTAVETASTIVSDGVIHAVRSVDPNARPVFSYLANSLAAGDRQVPYSLVTAVDPALMPIADNGIVLNEWAARELGATRWQHITMVYYVWTDGGSLATRAADLVLERVVPISGFAADRNLAPEYPGITEAKSLHDWDPPFPMNLKLIRPSDEDYWNRYRTTPKAFIAYETGRKLWGTRFGSATSMRLSQPPADVAERLRASIDPRDAGMALMDVRSAGREASRGSTDFGEYFAYFSFFVLASALILAGLLFRLSIEQRARDIGTLRAMGWSARRIAGVLIAEGSVVALAGCVLGSAGAAGYCALVLHGLRTWWQGAVGTTALRLAISPSSLTVATVSGFAMALGVMAWALRSLGKRSPRNLMTGVTTPELKRSTHRRSRWIATVAAVAGIALLVAGASGRFASEAGFFGGASLLLIAALVWIASLLGGTSHEFLALHAGAPLWKLGARSAAHRPGRATAGIALIASATFLIAGLDAFRQESHAASDPKSGTGGFAFVAESELPIYRDPNSLGTGAKFFAFRLKPGDDASCLNLYQPRNPRVLGAPESFLKAARFRFTSGGDNPWLLLDRASTDGAIPAIADANSITYVLHKKVGDELVIAPDSDHPVRLRIVAALEGSTLQSELIISERNFIRAFPDQQGYRFFLIDAPASAEGPIEEALSDYGFDAQASTERLASYRRVENTYLSTFQALGALGLLLGTVGLAAVLLRNVLERRRELALMRALGYERRDIAWVVVSENLFIAAAGLITGTACALIAVLPTVLARGGRPPIAAVAALIIAVPLTALTASLAAVRSVSRTRVMDALRAE